MKIGFFSLFQPSSDELKGLSSLRWEDQEKIKKSAAPGADDEQEEEDHDDEPDAEWSTEYAKSGKSTCKGCYKNIANKELRIGKLTTDNNYGYSNTHFYHVGCVDLPVTITSNMISGYSKLKPADKQQIDKAVAQNSKKRKELDEEQEENAKKKNKKLEVENKKNADKLWEIKDELKEKYKLNDLKEILAFNEQSDVGGFDVLLERVVDCKLNGTFPSCEACKGRLIKDHNKVKCTSHISSYSRCTFEANLDEVERDKFSMPSKKTN